MNPDKMISDMMLVGPFFLHLILSILGIAMVIGGLRDINEKTHFQHIVEVPVGFIGVIIGLLLMYYGNAFSVIWSIIKWVS